MKSALWIQLITLLLWWSSSTEERGGNLCQKKSDVRTWRVATTCTLQNRVPAVRDTVTHWTVRLRWALEDLPATRLMAVQQPCGTFSQSLISHREPSWAAAAAAEVKTEAGFASRPSYCWVNRGTQELKNATHRGSFFCAAVLIGLDSQASPSR